MAQKWYQKATVQSSIVNAIPNLITATIAIVSIWISTKYSSQQIRQAQDHFKTQITRDSVLNIEEQKTTESQIHLSELQLRLAREKLISDSTYFSRQTESYRQQLNLLEQQRKEKNFLIKQGLRINKIVLRRYETDFTQENIDSLCGYKPDYIFDNSNQLYKRKILMLHTLALYNRKDSSELTKRFNFFKLSEIDSFKAKSHILQSDLANLNTVKKYTFVIEFKNNFDFPIKFKDSNISIFLDKDSISNPPLSFDNAPLILPGDTHMDEEELIVQYDRSITGSVKFKFKIHYATINGEEELTSSYEYSFDDFSLYNTE